MASWYLSHDLPIPISRYRPPLDDDGFRLARHHSRDPPKVLPRRRDSATLVLCHRGMRNWREGPSDFRSIHQIFGNPFYYYVAVRFRNVIHSKKIWNFFKRTFTIYNRRRIVCRKVSSLCGILNFRKNVEIVHRVRANFKILDTLYCTGINLEFLEGRFIRDFRILRETVFHK